MNRNARAQEEFFDKLSRSLPVEARQELEELRRLYNLNPDDAIWGITAIQMKQAASQAEVHRHIEQTRTDIESLKIRIEETLRGLSLKADEFIVESDKLRSEIKVSDNITKYVAGSNRLRDLNTASSSPVRLKPLPLIVGASVAAFILGIFIAVLLLLLVLR